MSKVTTFWLVLSLLFVTVNVYLFATAPAPLEANKKEQENTFSVEDAFQVIVKLNNVTRNFYTKNIVGKGKKAGLKFDEHWLKKDVEAGPLPALFLRETAAVIEKSPIPLGLFLGSDYPIARANLYRGIQAQKFEEIKKDRQPKFFYDEDTERYIGMFPDIASAEPCVSCHNNHKDSPKNDWALGDVMGATTWSYPSDSLSVDELLSWVQIYKKGVEVTYSKYLGEVEAFKQNKIPEIGKHWPKDGYFLPSLETLQDTLFDLTSRDLIEGFLKDSNEG